MPYSHSTVSSPLGINFLEDIHQSAYPRLVPINRLLKKRFGGLIKFIGTMTCGDICTLLEKFEATVLWLTKKRHLCIQRRGNKCAVVWEGKIWRLSYDSDLRQILGKSSCRVKKQEVVSWWLGINFISYFLLIQNEDCQFVILILLTWNLHDNQILLQLSSTSHRGWLQVISVARLNTFFNRFTW